MDKHTRPILAILGTLLTFALFFSLLFVRIHTTEKDILIYILGVLSGVLVSIYTFYFGSSKGSDENRQALHNYLNNQQPETNGKETSSIAGSTETSGGIGENQAEP